ncbi:oxysterol-binding protein-related protein 9/10/11 [Microdochium nivale]|nr:oxysterol-binding protein-related protein 9/10/11 [Microdochium nivale]
MSSSERSQSPFSQLRDFLGYLATVKGDLSNVPAPPFLLAPRSVTEMPVTSAERQDLFLAPASEDDPEVRALLVLKSFLCSLKRQGYYVSPSPPSSTSSSPRSSGSLSRHSSPDAVNSEDERSSSPTSPVRGKESLGGAKKPLNAFLGEIFLAKFYPSSHRSRSTSSLTSSSASSIASQNSTAEDGNNDDDNDGATMLFVEQVSHHPPATACYTYNKRYGMSSEGYVAQETTFSATGGVRVSQVGSVIIRDSNHGESHLMTLPAMLLKGLLTGRPYPELDGCCYISSSSGYLATVGFTGTNSFGMGKKNSFNAKICSVREDDGQSAGAGNKQKPIYEVSGQWTGRMTVKDGRTGKVVEEFDVDDIPLSEAQLPPRERQSPWESRRAWHDVIEGIRLGNMERIARRKDAIETAQRQMREAERSAGIEWPRMFFQNKQQLHTAGSSPSALLPTTTTTTLANGGGDMANGGSPSAQDASDVSKLSRNAAEYEVLARAIPDENLRTVDPTKTGGMWSFVGIGAAQAILRDGLHFRSLEPSGETVNRA